MLPGQWHGRSVSAVIIYEGEGADGGGDDRGRSGVDGASSARPRWAPVPASSPPNIPLHLGLGGRTGTAPGARRHRAAMAIGLWSYRRIEAVGQHSSPWSILPPCATCSGQRWSRDGTDAGRQPVPVEGGTALEVPFVTAVQMHRWPAGCERAWARPCLGLGHSSAGHPRHRRWRCSAHLSATKVVSGTDENIPKEENP